ncbi:MAG: pyridine nucleotide-disulfide oxidoreductase, partial [Methylobacter tundripaludum]|nr:pyridine nucleotide-disulfide oxidoreductase [Methylobacter tundripaludum]
MEQHNLTLGIPGFNYSDLYDSARLKDLLDVFDASVERHDSELHSEFKAYRQNQGEGLAPETVSDLLVRMGPYVGQFVATLFNVSEQHQAQGAKIKDEIDTIFTYKNEIVDKLAFFFKGQDASDWAIPDVLNRFDLLIEAGFPEANQDEDAEHRVARVGAAIGLLYSHYKLVAKGKDSDYENADLVAEALRAKLSAHQEAAIEFKDIIGQQDLAEFINGLMDIVLRWSFVAQQDNDVVASWPSFKLPGKRDFDHLVEHELVDRGEFKAWMGEQEHRRRRDGFKLTDPRY